MIMNVIISLSYYWNLYFWFSWKQDSYFFWFIINKRNLFYFQINKKNSLRNIQLYFQIILMIITYIIFKKIFIRNSNIWIWRIYFEILHELLNKKISMIYSRKYRRLIIILSFNFSIMLILSIKWSYISRIFNCDETFIRDAR